MQESERDIRTQEQSTDPDTEHRHAHTYLVVADFYFKIMFHLNCFHIEYDKNFLPVKAEDSPSFPQSLVVL